MNNDIKIRRATTEDIPVIREMAEVVFRSTYADILSAEQMDYMMEWMYSAESLTVQVCADGKEFYIAETADRTPCGYVSFEEESQLPDGRKLYHLQKIYVMPGNQGSGIGKKLFEFTVNRLRQANPNGCRMELNVNRHNKAVNFYQKMGMFQDRQGDFDIGNGYYMNDYIYALDISSIKAKRAEPEPDIEA